jgi:tRNA threonylcarbamoyl adenosine modification protein YeaZ/ribosomal-protein-alanine acetyltransferase
MVILALDTTTRAGSLALAVDDRIDARMGDPSRTHGERLPQDLLDLLSTRDLTPADVDRFAVLVGPGSFTGLRVGLATIQGLALAGGRLIVPVPTLDAILDGWRAESRSPAPGVLVAWMDGQRRDVFYGAWRHSGVGERGEVVLDPRASRPDDLIRDLRAAAADDRVTFVSPAPVDGRDEVVAAFPDADFQLYGEPLAAVAARLAVQHPDRAVAPHALRPIYLRRPDAELARARAGRAPVEADVTVSRLSPGDDLAAIAELQRRAFTNPWGADSIQWELANTDVARLYVAHSPDGAVVAYCACWLIFDELHINSLAVDEAVRRRGVARRLLREVFRDAIRAGAQSATLEVRRSNEAARRLYLSLGFVVDAVRRDYYQLPREDALILWHRQLAGPGSLW